MGSQFDNHPGNAGNIAASALLAAFCLVVLAPAGPADAQAPPRDLIALKRDYRRPPPLAVENPALVDLGRELFFDPRISASGKTACASCHAPALGWVVTDARPINDSGKPTGRKSQPLIGLGHAGNAPVGWDGRNATPRSAGEELDRHGLDVDARDRHAGQSRNHRGAHPDRRRTMSRNSTPRLPGKPINVDTIAQAIAAFERTIEPGLAPFDRWVGGRRGRDPAIRQARLRACSPARPAARPATAAGDSPTTNSTTSARRPPISDADGAVKDESLNYAFKTPTLRSVALRAPYMHNASAATLGDVREVLRKGRHRAPEPLSHAVSVRIDRPGTDRPRRLHGDADGRRRNPGQSAVAQSPMKSAHPQTSSPGLSRRSRLESTAPSQSGWPGRARP